MKTATLRLLALFPLLAGMCSCSLTRVAKAEPLKPGVKYEVRSPEKKDSAVAAKDAAPYFFMLDAPAPLFHEPIPGSLDASNLTVRTTAYCHSESDHIRYGRLTAGGGILKFGTICSAAADWSRYPVGTRFRIASQPEVVYEVDDYGSALVGSGTIDLYRPSEGSMNAWGVRDVDIEILQWGSYQDSLRLMRTRVHFPHVRQMISSIERKMSQASASASSKPTPLVAAIDHS